MPDAVIYPDPDGGTYSRYAYAFSDAKHAQPTVTGIAIWVTWATLEYLTKSNWQFTGAANSTFIVDQVYNYCKTNGLKLTLVINPNVFNSGSPAAPKTTDSRVVPMDLLNDPSLYGAGLVGNSGVAPTGASGYWVQQTGGWCANLENANVQARFLAMLTHLAAVFDNDPVVEAVILDAMDAMYPTAGSGATGAPFWSAFQNIMLAMKAAFKHTNVAIQVAWGGTPSQAFTQTLVQNGIGVSTSDTIGESAFQDTFEPLTFASAPTGNGGTLTATWSWGTDASYHLRFSTGQVVTAKLTHNSTAVIWTPAVAGSPTASATVNLAPQILSDGMQAWLGVQSVEAGSTWTPPTPPLQTGFSAFPLVEGGDFTDPGVYPGTITISDICDACNGAYKASHVHLTDLTSGQTTTVAAQWPNVLPVLKAKPLTNTAYPASVAGY